MAPFLADSPSVTIHPVPLTAAGFAPFGDFIGSPLSPMQATIPSDLSDINRKHRDRHHSSPSSPCPPATSVFANQHTAVKTSPISPFINAYAAAPSGRSPAPVMSMFSCFPRTLRRAGPGGSGSNSGGGGPLLFDVRILERHPYTTQTFSPLGLSADPSTPTFYLVVVAPTLHGRVATVTTTVPTADGGGSLRRSVEVRDPPDLTAARAFVARGGNAVTYGPGTWHAPMVVVGDARVDFVVSQFANGVGAEDCEECEFGEGVVVDMGDKVAKL